MGRFMAFTRAQESSADLAGAKYLSAAGISGKGSLEFFKKLQNQEYRLAIYATESYDRTHPLSSERISILENLYKKDEITYETAPAVKGNVQSFVSAQGVIKPWKEVEVKSNVGGRPESPA